MGLAQGNPASLSDIESDGSEECDNHYGIDPGTATEAHNRLRALHGAGELEWCDECAQHAQLAVQTCVQQNQMTHNNCQEYGEGQNLYMCYGQDAGAKVAIDSWYSEKDDYDFDNPGFNGSTGHFTQLVWCGTTKFGMAKATTDDGTIYIAANYGEEAGNMQGAFEDNVLPEQ
mmetsp:Transcript_10267/g.16775  ORF Transcript_10267/g.16775 Transcript_10267/m.16775 type:complete len:173 (-) Transcript_10267:38-556(-)|eukprot:CAMPEP_0169065934 /NCGR_PEP_ID=MMETSP1015-20121227/2674_1 /TAXON_ID=342587 /ORGANISM="Karlodinium micrum, Strain CCMP2283" /LENGTH=172 /DNA_ID=CAMNT_0009124553 /DNA_START=70 /DNA_END=588 /DNA_ORIENTATION=+